MVAQSVLSINTLICPEDEMDLIWGSDELEVAVLKTVEPLNYDY